MRTWSFEQVRTSRASGLDSAQRIQSVWVLRTLMQCLKKCITLNLQKITRTAWFDEMRVRGGDTPDSDRLVPASADNTIVTW